MPVSQPPRLDSPVHAQQESSSGDEGQTGRRFFAVDQTTNVVGIILHIVVTLHCIDSILEVEQSSTPQ